MGSIAFESVTKSFERSPHRLLLRGYAARLFGQLGEDRFVALHDISFKIEPGESVGVIGSNGAGKSTLLGMIAGLCPPDSGRIAVTGRVAALLQLGAGFHPDLTGVENVYLNAALLGMSQKQVDAVFPSIQDFAGIGDHIHQPQRTYSQGMTMRLAFSIAIQSHPEILIVDEVLAVGDQAFQEKCFAKVQEMKRAGVTLLFVSHSPGAVQSICARALWLDRGALRMDGPCASVVAAYLESGR